MISNLLQDGFFQVNQNGSSIGVSSDSLQLTGFDTRDSEKLINVFSLNNDFTESSSGMLCAQGNDIINCPIPVPNNIPTDPANPGTEFIALQLRNMNPNSVFLINIQVNNELHEWDDGTAGTQFDATLNIDAGTKYPKAGYFSIIPSPERPNSEIQFASQEVQGNEEVRVIIKLSEDLSDIEMWDSMLIVVNFGGSQPAEFILLSGDAKW